MHGLPLLHWRGRQVQVLLPGLLHVAKWACSWPPRAPSCRMRWSRAIPIRRSGQFSRCRRLFRMGSRHHSSSSYRSSRLLSEVVKNARSRIVARIACTRARGPRAPVGDSSRRSPTSRRTSTVSSSPGATLGSPPGGAVCSLRHGRAPLSGRGLTSSLCVARHPEARSSLCSRLCSCCRHGARRRSWDGVTWPISTASNPLHVKERQVDLLLVATRTHGATHLVDARADAESALQVTDGVLRIRHVVVLEAEPEG
mmetsp:Transcript_36178/g.77144  ORF Transcript_36178/g.77144 Transcript_36178/m.77144 type:complete len:255 (-) Transcript_36178:528-1292(-)